MRSNCIEALTAVRGIGTRKASEIVRKYRICDVTALRKLAERKPAVLTHGQMQGLAYHEDLAQRIPRDEVKKHAATVRRALRPDLDVEAVHAAGSYRRGAPDSGDVDLVIAATGRHAEVMDRIVSALSVGYLVTVISSGTSRLTAVVRLPGFKNHRQLDILLCTPAELPFALLYFTGSKELNIVMRMIAAKKGYKLSQHGFSPKPRKSFESEKDIFDFLDLQYIPPKSRGDLKKLTHK